MKTKHCPHCMLTKPLDQFHKDSKGKDGHSARCGECRNARKRVKDPFTEYNGKKKPEGNPNGKPVSIPISQEINDQLDDGVHDLEAFERVIDSLYKAQGKFFTFQFFKSGASICFHGTPSVTFKGTIREVLEEALS